MRKNKIVKRKEIIFDLDEWAAVERKASEINITTSDYIRRMAVNEGNITHIDLKNAVPLMNALRVIGNNINQIARKANEINSIYADDVQMIIKRTFCSFYNLPSFAVAAMRRAKGYLKYTVNDIHVV